MDLLRLLELLQTPYCERLGPGLLAEPLNAVSNLAFAVTAILGARWMRRQQRFSSSSRMLPPSLGVVAAGSALYHTLRSPATFVLDALSLLLFVVLAIAIVLREAKLKAGVTMNLLLVFICVEAGGLFLLPQRFLNGSAAYLLMLSCLLLLMGLIARSRRSLLREMVPILFLFGTAVFFRTIDTAVCPWFPSGTHFLWHLAAAAAACYVIRFVLLLEKDRLQRSNG
jgi:hypothetical protein